MYIAVICGGLSAERDVSISSGTGAARALRARGHKVALVDLFLGNPSAMSDPRSAFTSDAGDSVYSVRETEPDLDKIRAQRGGMTFQPGHCVRAVLVQVDQFISGGLPVFPHQSIIDAGAKPAFFGIAPRQKAQIVSGPARLIGEDFSPLPASAVHQHQ